MHTLGLLGPSAGPNPHSADGRPFSAAEAPLEAPSRPDQSERVRELLTRLQEAAVETVLAHLTDTEVDPAPLIVDPVLEMESKSHPN
jgi:hypothetical protein